MWPTKSLTSYTNFRTFQWYMWCRKHLPESFCGRKALRAHIFPLRRKWTIKVGKEGCQIDKQLKKES